MQPINRYKVYENALVYHGYPRDVARVVAFEYIKDKKMSRRRICRKYGVWNSRNKTSEYYPHIMEMLDICRQYEYEMKGIRYVL